MMCNVKRERKVFSRALPVRIGSVPFTRTAGQADPEPFSGWSTFPYQRFIQAITYLGCITSV